VRVRRATDCRAHPPPPPTALLVHTARPADAEIDAAMEGNICRCGCYTRIRTAIKQLGESQQA
jgi:isoquinoline 1-oxidoreductase subunit alpha